VSERTILRVLRSCLALWGLLWIAAGVAHVAFPELLPPETQPLSSGERAVFAAFACPFGAVLAATPRFFARNTGVFVIALLLALALPVTTLALTPVTLRGCLSIAALCLFPLLMQTLLVSHARSQLRGG
jgi:hypothetical protein